MVEVGATVAVIGEDSVEDLAPKREPESVAPAAAQPVSSDRVEKLPGIRRTIARRMLDSPPTSAQLATVVEVDVTSVARLRVREKAEFQRRHGAKLSFLPFFVAAAVEALAEHPVINGPEHLCSVLSDSHQLPVADTLARAFGHDDRLRHQSI